ncbi:hypothetical protein [Rhodoblastus sp.]|uniref:hypothetical protein n=1 Tax=Rhodoblastus sp. TaxID=1962975 RepID=UPI003F96425C
MGAPLRYTSANTARSHGFAGNCLFQCGFVSDNPHDAVVDLDPVDDRLDIRLAEGDVAGGDVFAHGAAETLDRFGIESRWRCGLRFDPVERSFAAVAVELEAGDPIFEDVVEVSDTIFDHFIEPFQLFFRVGHFGLQCGDPPVDFERLFRAPDRGRGEDRGQALGLEQALGQMLRHQIVEFLHRDRAALAGGLALPGAGRASVIFVHHAGL